MTVIVFEISKFEVRRKQKEKRENGKKHQRSIGLLVSKSTI